MEDGLFTKQGKKLLMIGVFLWCVAALVGREEDPGMIANLAEGGPGAGPVSAGPVSASPPPSAAVVHRPAPAPRREDPGLSAWYAEADSNTGPAEPEPFVPAPVDNSHLINDARPIGSSQPVG